jgi:hypothetical protein
LHFDVEPAIDATTGTLSFTAAVNTSGTATVQVVLRDDGNDVPPNSNSSAPQTFTIEIGTPSGDYSHNQLTDAADYVTWRKTEGSTVKNRSGADGNGDGNVGPEDYDIWRATFGNVMAVASGSAIGLADDTSQANAVAQSAAAESANVTSDAVVESRHPIASLNALAVDALTAQHSNWRSTAIPGISDALSERSQVSGASHRFEELLTAWLTRSTFVRGSATRPMADTAHDDDANPDDLQIEMIDSALETLADYLPATSPSHQKAFG